MNHSWQSNSIDSLKDQLTSLSGDLGALAPELAIISSLLLILAYDLIFNKHKEIGLASIAFCGLLATAGILVVQWLNFQEPTLLMNKLLRFDQLAVFLKILFSTGGILGLIIAARSKTDKALFRSGEFLMILFGLILGVFLMSSADNLLMIYLSIELVSICSYLLTGLLKGKARSEASLKYLLFGAVSSAVMLYGMSWLYGFTGTLHLDDTFYTGLAAIPSMPLIIAMIMVLAGFIFKLGAVPFHIWSPDVYEAAPTSLVAIFSTLPKLAALSLVFRWVLALPTDLFDWQLVLGVVAIASMTFGNFSALWQKDAKRLLAYSSIAHAGFLLVGLVANSSGGTQAMLFYGTVYLVMNFGAFLLIQFIENHTGSSKLEGFKGLGTALPYLGILFVVVMIALTGLPPTVGFNAKLYIFSAVWEAWQEQGKPVLLWLFVFGLINTALALFYYLKIPYFMFFKAAAGSEPKSQPAANVFWGTILILPLLLWFFRSEWLMEALNSINFVF